MRGLYSRRAAVAYACVFSTLAVATTHAGCSPDSGGEADAGPDRGGGIIPPPAPADAGSCDLTKPFGDPAIIPSVNLPDAESGTLSADERTFYNMVKKDGWWHIYASKRQNVDGEFGPPQLFEGIRPKANLPEDFDPFLSFDGTEFFFSSIRTDSGPGTPGHFDIMVARRLSPDVPFDEPIGVGKINTTGIERAPAPVANNSVLYFSSQAGENAPARIYKSARWGADFGASEVVDLGPTPTDSSPLPDQSDLTLFFSSTRPGGQKDDIWVARRQSVTEKFEPPTNTADVAALNSAWNDAPRWLSADGCRIYLASDRPIPNGAEAGKFRMYVAKRPK
ncbi:hypothetical protein LVJ94_45665 [Pendulispora rubella]|uniref:Uncharacterized protein n=1 Tax=Pendulispora rubella TaxID=2741070 RepID=A0ABZ2L2H6_9BACT